VSCGFQGTPIGGTIGHKGYSLYGERTIGVIIKRHDCSEEIPMRVHITDIFAAHQQPAVRFSSAIGVSIACWKSDRDPVLNATPQIEFDIDAPLQKGQNAVSADKAVYAVDHHGNHAVVLCGMVDAVDDDGMVYFRLAEDCIVMIEARPGQVVVGEWLRLHYDLEHVGIIPVGV
jgi:hypothetical protein